MTEENEFKVGDKVECVESGNPYNHLTEGKIYVVKKIKKLQNNDDLIGIIDDSGQLCTRFKHRFKLVKQGKMFIFRKNDIKKG